MSISLSLVIPAYNEATRLPRYLTEIRSYLPTAFGDNYEVLVVDDGSQDDTPALAARFGSDWACLRWLRHETNLGKGAAVRTGMLASRGELLLFADADGATPIGEESRLREAVSQGADLALGSRLLRSSEVSCNRTRRRALIGALFAASVRLVMRLPVKDTQCGFKMFRREIGQSLFADTVEQGYLFDVEVLMLATRRGYRIAEVPIHWSDQPGSRLDLACDSWRIARGLWQLRRRQITLRDNH